MKRIVFGMWVLALGGCGMSLPKLGLGSSLTTASPDRSLAVAGSPNTFSPASGDMSDPCPRQTAAKKAAQKIVVRIRATRESKRNVFGSGIILAVQGNSLFVLTAKHVVVDAGDAPKQILVEAPDVSLGPAKLIAQFEDDVAVLEVPIVSGVINVEWQILFNQERGTSDIAQLYTFGFESETGEQKESKPGLASQRGRSFTLSSNIRQGHSGGGTFNVSGQLVGLTVLDESSGGEALAIWSTLDLVRERNIPVDLRVAPADRYGIYVNGVVDLDGNAEFGKAVEAAVFSEFEKRGLEPRCASTSAYKLDLSTQSWDNSATTRGAHITGVLVRPNGTTTEGRRLAAASTKLVPPRSLADQVPEMAQQVADYVTKMIGSRIPSQIN